MNRLLFKKLTLFVSLKLFAETAPKGTIYQLELIQCGRSSLKLFWKVFRRFPFTLACPPSWSLSAECDLPLQTPKKLSPPSCFPPDRTSRTNRLNGASWSTTRLVSEIMEPRENKKVICAMHTVYTTQKVIRNLY